MGEKYFCFYCEIEVTEEHLMTAHGMTPEDYDHAVEEAFQTSYMTSEGLLVVEDESDWRNPKQYL